MRVGVLKASLMAIVWKRLRKDNSRMRESSPAELSPGGRGDTSESKLKVQGGLEAEQKCFLSR